MRDRTVEVIDGFLANPDRVQQTSASVEWVPLNAAAPGQLRSSRCFATEDSTVGLATLVGRPPTYTAEDQTFGFYTFLADGATAPTEATMDGYRWAAILYLTPPDLCSGGISFLRGDDAGVPEVTMHVPIRFNRLLIFQPDLVRHEVGPGFGDDPLSGRLAQVFLFN